MDMITPVLYYGSLVATIILPAGGVGFGQSRITATMLTKINEQPTARKELSTLFYIALAISETTAIFCIMMGLSLIFSPCSSFEQAVAAVGILCALALPCLCSGIMSSYPTQTALTALARQPQSSSAIIKTMILGQTILQTPVIFGLIIALIIKTQSDSLSIALALKSVAAGLALFTASIGPTIGLSNFSKTACRLLGVHPQAYDALINFVLMSQALIETPILFGFLAAIIIIAVPLKSTLIWATVPLIMAALACGMSTLGPGISSGQTAAQAAQALAQTPEHAPTISRTSMLAQVIIDTSAIYGLVVALLIIFTH